MKTLKYFFGIASFLVIAVSCKKEKFEDTSFLQTATLPQNLSIFFEITQDNSGKVTITPNGEGVSVYDIYYGDVASAHTKVSPGQNTMHQYAEGTYQVKVIAYGPTGQKTETTKPLTVSFRAPENLAATVTIDPANSFKVDVTATALYETGFKVYFGDVPNEVPQSFTEGTTISHIYSAVGTYNITVVAVGGSSATIQTTQPVTIVNSAITVVLLPITFESSTVNYAFTDFGGGNVTVINNPQASGINTSAKVAQMVKNAGQTYGGSFITLGSPINFPANKIFKMKVFSPRIGAKVLLKVENLTNSSQNFEVEVTTTVANAWEELSFDYNAINTANTYQKVVLIFDNGTAGDGSPNFTFLFDDITF